MAVPNIKDVQLWREEKQKAKDRLLGVKNYIQKQFEDIILMIKEIESDGEKNILSDPQFDQVRRDLGIGTSSSPAAASGQKKNKSADITAAILKVLDGESLGASEIQTKIAALLPLPVGPISIKLGKMVEEKVISSAGKGKARKYSLPKK